LAEIRNLFIDNGGVITDSSSLPPQYRRLVGEFFVPRLGGTAEAWGEANTATFPEVWGRFVGRLEKWDATSQDLSREAELWYLDWFRSMCVVLNIHGPAADEDCIELAAACLGWIENRVDAVYAGAVEALDKLGLGFSLYSASDGLSYRLAPYFARLGIDRHFRTLYGPDLVNMPKQVDAYYPRIFEHAGVDPASVLVVDDSPMALHRARKAGARTVLVAASVPPGDSFDAVIPRLADLPAILAGWKDGG